MKKAYMVIGCPGSGKSWVCDQLKELFDYVHHDLYIGMAGDTYVREILKRSEAAKRPLLIEAPFSISQIKDPLESMGFEITPIFIQEDHDVISDRYRAREGKQIPKGHLTRQNTYLQRADEWGSFRGTSNEVLAHLMGEAGFKPLTPGANFFKLTTEGSGGGGGPGSDWSHVADAIETPTDSMPKPTGGSNGPIQN